MIVLLVLSAGAFAVGGAALRRALAEVALATEARANEDAEQERWKRTLAAAVVIDPTQPLTATAGTLVVATGTLAGEGALRDDVLGIERPGALTLRRTLWFAEHTSQVVTTEKWDPVRRPSDRGWRTANDGITRREVKSVGGVRWQPASANTPRAQGSAVQPGEELRASTARIGSVPLSEAFVTQVPESPVPLPDDVVTRLDEKVRASASLVDEVTLQLGDGRADSHRVVLVERAPDEVTVLARSDGKQLTLWNLEGSDVLQGKVLPGRHGIEDFMPARSEVVAARPTSVTSMLLDDPPRLGLVAGGLLLGLLFLGLALFWRP